MKQMFTSILTGLTVMSGFAADRLADTNAVVKIERIALFKNGLGYATASATLPGEARVVRLGQLPVPSYGTFWVSYGKNLPLRNLTTAMETVDDLIPAASVDELMRLNPGKRVVLHLSGTATGEHAVVSGVLQPLPKPRSDAEPPSPYFMDFRHSPDRPSYYGYVTPAVPSIALVKTDRGMVALAPGT